MIQSPLTVGDVMLKICLQIDGMATVKDALDAMFEKHADVLIVTRRNDHDEHGIVLLTDIVSQVLAPNRAPERVNVYEIMSKPVISVNPGMSVKNCARLFTNFGISTAPVIQDEEILGIVGYRQLAFGGMQPQAGSAD